MNKSPADNTPPQAGNPTEAIDPSTDEPSAWYPLHHPGSAVGKLAGTLLDTARNAAQAAKRTIDPVAVGGAVAGPAAAGAGVGAFAGAVVGSKLGYDVTHEVVAGESAEIVVQQPADQSRTPRRGNRPSDRHRRRPAAPIAGIPGLPGGQCGQGPMKNAWIPSRQRE